MFVLKELANGGRKPTQGYINMRKSVGTTSTTGSINADGKKYSIDSIQAEVVLENWRFANLLFSSLYCHLGEKLSLQKRP